MAENELFHTDCYTGFDLVKGEDHEGGLKITLVGYWEHKSDADSGVDELADFIVTEYTNEKAIEAKAEKVVELLNGQLDFLRCAKAFGKAGGIL